MFHFGQEPQINTFIQNKQWNDLKDILENALEYFKKQKGAMEKSLNLYNFLKNSKDLAENERVYIAKLFLEMGANPMQILFHNGFFEDEATSLREAIRQGNYELTTLLLTPEYNADLTVRVGFSKLLDHIFNQNFSTEELKQLLGFFPEVIDEDKWGYDAALNIIIQDNGRFDIKDRLQLAKSIILKGGSQSGAGYEADWALPTCLHHAVKHKESEDGLKLVNLLLRNNPHSKLFYYNPAPIVVALTLGHLTYVTAIIDYLFDNPGKNLNDEFQCGRALCELIRSKDFNYATHHELVELLIQTGAGRGNCIRLGDETIYSIPNNKEYLSKVKEYSELKKEYCILVEEDYLFDAIKIENLPLVHLLLQKNVIITGDAILSAAKKGYWDLVELFLKDMVKCPIHYYNNIMIDLLESSYDKSKKINLARTLIEFGAEPVKLLNYPFDAELYALILENPENATLENAEKFMPITIAVKNDAWDFATKQLRVLENRLINLTEEHEHLKVIPGDYLPDAPQIENLPQELKFKNVIITNDISIKDKIKHQIALCLYFMLEKLATLEEQNLQDSVDPIFFLITEFIDLGNPGQCLAYDMETNPINENCIDLALRKNIRDEVVMKLLFDKLEPKDLIKYEKLDRLYFLLKDAKEQNVTIDINSLTCLAISCESYASLEICFNPQFWQFTASYLKAIFDDEAEKIGISSPQLEELDKKNDWVKVLLKELTDVEKPKLYKYRLLSKIFIRGCDWEPLIKVVINALENYLQEFLIMSHYENQLTNIETLIKNKKWDDLKNIFGKLPEPIEINREITAKQSQNLFYFLKNSENLAANERLKIATLFLEIGGAHPTATCVELNDRGILTTCLHESLRQSNYELAMLLLTPKFEANLNEENSNYAKPLPYAFKQNFSAEQLEQLLDFFPEFVAYDKGYDLALFEIIGDRRFDIKSRLKLASCLILKGAEQSVNYNSPTAETCLSRAVKNEETEDGLNLLNLLLEDTPESKWGYILVALKLGHFTYIEAIIDSLLNDDELLPDSSCNFALIELANSKAFNYEQHLDLVELMIVEFMEWRRLGYYEGVCLGCNLIKYQKSDRLYFLLENISETDFKKEEVWKDLIPQLIHYAISCESYDCLEICFNPKYFPQLTVFQLKIIFDDAAKNSGVSFPQPAGFSIVNTNSETDKKNPVEVILNELTAIEKSKEYKHGIMQKIFKIDFPLEQTYQIVRALINALEKYLHELSVDVTESIEKGVIISQK